MFHALEKTSPGYVLCEMIEETKTTPLPLARQSVDRVAGLTNCGQLDVPRRRGRNLLQLACEYNKPDFVRLLLEAKAGTQPKSFSPGTTNPLASAVKNHNEEIVRVLLQAGINPNYTSGNTLYSALYDATENTRDPQNMRMNYVLLENGAVGHGITTLHLSRLDLRDLPGTSSYWQSFSSLTYLNLSHNNFLSVPPVLSSIPSLVYLSLSNNYLHSFSPSLAGRASLKVLDLSYNNLQTLPATLATLPALQKVLLDGNPLTDIPISFRNSGWSSELKTYLRSILEKSEDFLERKILLVGQEGVGKSTLLRCLCEPKGRTNTKHNISTDGIGVKSFTLSTNMSATTSRLFPRTKTFQFTAWDLGGQEVFYPSHQFFLTSQSIYLVVFNLAQPHFERLEYWMNQLRSSAPAGQLSPILLIGTHADSPGCHDSAFLARVKAEIRTRFPTQRFPALQGSMICDCGSGGGVAQIKEKLLVVASNMKTIVSPSWICLQQLLHRKLEQQINYLTWADYLSLAARSNVEREELSMTTKFLQDVGCVIHFDDDRSKLQELVILHPQWLASLMASFVSFSHRWDRDGRIGRSQIAQVLKAYPPPLHEPLLDLLEKFGILVRLPRKNYTQVLIPSLLPEQRPDNFYLPSAPVDPQAAPGWVRTCPATSVEHSRIFDFPFLPLGFFDRVLVGTYFLPVATDPLITWRHGTLLERKDHPEERCLITFTASVEKTSALYTLTVRARMEMNAFSQGSPNVLLNEVVHLVEHIISCYFPRLQDGVRRYIPCLHCVRHQTVISEPYQFSYEECVAAVTRGVPILYCRGIRTPQRSVLVSSLAPDITFRGYAVLKAADLGDRDRDWKLLGEGGFGRVYRTSYEGKEVAVKELLSDEAGSNITEKFSEFQKEVQIMSVLRHQNIVNLIGLTIKPLLIVSEFVRGGDLHQVMADAENPLSWAQRYRIAFDIAAGMEYLQAFTPPIVHRDLRSPNIFIESLDVHAPVCAKVADFGLSAFVAQDVAGSLLTWQWLAPEVLNYDVKSYDERSDIYSFAIVLWELLTTEMPFEEFSKQTPDPHAIKRAIIHSGLRPTIPEDCPPDYKSLMEACWNHSPLKRPSFTEILQTLAPHVPDDVHISRTAERDALHSAPMVVLSGQEDSEALGRRGSLTEIAPLKRPHEVPLGEAISCLLIYAEALWVGMDSGKIQVYNLSQIDHVPLDEDCLKLGWSAHKDRVFAMILVPKRRQSEVWSGSGDRKIVAWDGHSGQCLWETELRSMVSGLLYVPEKEDGTGGAVWAAAGEENALYMFSGNDHSMLRLVALPNNSPCFSIAMHLGMIMVGTLGTVLLFDTCGNELASWGAHRSDRPVRFIASSSATETKRGAPNPSEGRIWTSAGNAVKQWSFPPGQEISITGFSEVTAHDARLTSMNLLQRPDSFPGAGDGALELWTSSYDYCNFVWDAEATQPFFEFQLGHSKEFMRDVVQFRTYVIVGSSYREDRSDNSCGSLYFYRQTDRV